MGVGIQFMILAGFFSAASNYFMRRSIDAGGSTKAFLMVQLTITFLVAVLLNPVRTGDFSWNSGIGFIGILGGLVLAFMMITLGKALETGSSSLTFAILNSSTVMPILFMVMLFGSSFGFVYNFYHFIGSLLVLVGLFWAGKEAMRLDLQKKWLLFAFSAFFLHIVFLVVMQWRALVIHFPHKEGLYVSFDLQELAASGLCRWFFLSAALVQCIRYVKTEKRKPKPQEVLFGVFGGVANAIATFLMIRSTEVSTSLEHAMIFPVFAVVVLTSCNIWSQFLYKEKIHWKASAFCIMGILVGTLDWRAIFN